MNQPEDVEFILAHDRHYKFHASVLARNSTMFSGLFIEPYAAKLNNKAKNAGIKTRWMIELTRLPEPGNAAGSLELVELNAMGEPLEVHNGMVVNENGRVPTKVFEHYESILYAFYNKEIIIDDDDMCTALADAGEMIKIAEYLGCIPLISKPIEVALLKHGQTMFQAIAKKPVEWIHLALRIKSELIFKEALIHIAGNWNCLTKDPESVVHLKDLPSHVRKLAQEHHDTLVSKAKGLEQALVTAYPGHMLSPSLDLPIKREEYAREILVWIALCFFRHWLGQCIVKEQGSTSDDGGFALYTQIYQAGEAYMDKSIIDQFHTKAPMTKKAMNVLENHLLEIKECMKGFIEKHGMLKSLCQLDVNKFPVEYLTCVDVPHKDLPWVKDENRQSPTPGSKRGWRPSGNEIVQQNLRAAQRMAQMSESGVEKKDDMDDEELQHGGDFKKQARYHVGSR